MANTTHDLLYEPIGSGGRNFNLAVDGGATIYKGTMVSQLTATSMAVPATTALSGRVVGVSTHGSDNSAGADAAVRQEVHSDRIFAWPNGTGVKAASEATPLFSPLYAHDDHTVSVISAGNTLPFAGLYCGMEPDGKVRCYIPICNGDVVEDGLDDEYTAHGVRGSSTADVANIAVFTVAGVDGLTYVQGERILLRHQALQEQNGVYVVGVVAGGVAPLTRAIDADGADEIVPGMVVTVSEGTLFLDTAWKLDTNAPIVIGTDNLVFTQIAYGYGAVGLMVAETIGQAAGAGTNAAAARIDHVHAMPASAVVVNTGAVNAAGAAGTFADSAHVHAEHYREVRGVAVTNVADLAAFVVAAFDGVTYVAGDLVLLANQTVPAEAGVYVVGAVAGTAPLTRAPWLPAAAVVRGGYTVHVEEGTLFARTNWFIAEAGDITIAATAHTWYPETATFSLGIPADTGTITFATIPILSATKTNYVFTNVAEVTADATVRYGLNGAATPGVVGTCTVTMLAELAAGTVNVDDDSTMIITVINR